MAVIKPIFTYADLADTPDDGRRYEIIEGELVVSPSPVEKHQRVVGNVFELFLRARRAGYGRAYVAPFDVIFDDLNAMQPDVIFIGRERQSIIKREGIRGAPDLVVEILSESTRHRDVGVKLRAYARFGVTRYWVIDPVAEALQPYVLTDNGYTAQTLLKSGDELVCPLFPGIVVDVGELFLE